MARSSGGIGLVLITLAVLAFAAAPGDSRGQSPKKGGMNKAPARRPANPSPPIRGMAPRPRKQAAPEKEPAPRPPAAIPTRPVRTPVDLSDSKACYRELAVLASFPMKFNDPWDYRPEAVGEDYGIFPPDPIEQLDRAVRFDRLRRSSDPRFVALVEEVRGIGLDAWRVNRANHDHGDSPARRKAAENRLFAAAVGKVLSNEAATAAARDAATTRYRSGRTQLDQDLFSRLMKDDPRVRRSGDRLEQAREQARAEPERLQQVSRALAALLAQVQDRMAGVWREKLMPELRKDGGPALDGPQVEVGDPEKMLPKIAAIPVPTMVAIRNASGRALHHVTIEVGLANGSGDRASWYAHVPVLEPGQYLTNVTYNPYWGMAYYSDRVEATVTLVGLDGSVAARKLELVADPRLASRENSPLRGRTRDQLLADLRSEQARAPETFEILEKQYGTPRNPETARSTLLDKVRTGRPYRATLDPRDGPTTITFTAIGDAPGTIRAEVTRVERARGPAGEKTDETFALLGRLVEEVDRGCVIALVRAAPSRSASLAASPPAARTKIGKNMPPGKVKALTEAREEGASQASRDREQRWERGEIPVLTTPEEILAHAAPDISTSDLLSKKLVAKIEDARDLLARSENPQYVVFLDSGDELAVQSPPGTDRRVTFAPLGR